LCAKLGKGNAHLASPLERRCPIQKSVPRAFGPSQVSSLAVQRLRPMYGAEGGASLAPADGARRIPETGFP
jgi:hypothetical protein